MVNHNFEMPASSFNVAKYENASGIYLISSSRKKSYIVRKDPGELVLKFHIEKYNIFNQNLSLKISNVVFSENSTECMLKINKYEQISFNAAVITDGSMQELTFRLNASTGNTTELVMECMTNLRRNPFVAQDISFTKFLLLLVVLLN